MKNGFFFVSMKKQIFICGYSLRTAQSNSPYELHQNLINKLNMVTSDSNRFEPGTFNTPQYAGKIKQDLNLFDNSFFNVSGSQAERLDPQIRLLLETSFEAVIDSGLDTETLNGDRKSV